MIVVPNELDAQLKLIAKRNHRSKRMEALAAIDYYVTTNLPQIATSSSKKAS
jgi:predicted transcriptional regulator